MTVDSKVLQGLVGHWGHEDLKDQLDNRDSLGLLDRQVSLVLWGHQERRVSRALLVQLDSLVFLEKLAQLDHRDREVSVVLWDCLVQQVRPVLLDRQDTVAVEDNSALQVLLVCLVQLVTLDQRAQQDLQAIQESPVTLASEEAQEQLDLKVNKVPVDRQGRQDPQELLDILVPLVRKDELATRAGQVVLVSRALQVPQATLEGQVGLVQEVHPALDGVLPLHSLQDEAGVLQDVYDSQQRGIANAKSHLSIVSTLLVGWAVIITVAVLILLVVAFTRLRRSRLFDVTDVQSSVAAAGIDVASWSCDAEAGLPASSHQPARPSTVLESDMEPDDLPVDMSRLSTMCSSEDKQQSLTGAVVSEDELNTRDIPRFVHTTATSTST